MSKLSAILALSFAACASSPAAPTTVQARVTLDDQANTALLDMRERDPGLDTLLMASAGYAVFPEIGAAGAVVAGGAYGRGVLYQHGQPVGYVKLEQGSLGPQLGGQTFAELLVLRSRDDIARLQAGTFDVSADASAVVLQTGAAASARFAEGATVFVVPRGGPMAGIAISEQRIEFVPRG